MNRNRDEKKYRGCLRFLRFFWCFVAFVEVYKLQIQSEIKVEGMKIHFPVLEYLNPGCNHREKKCFVAAVALFDIDTARVRLRQRVRSFIRSSFLYQVLIYLFLFNSAFSRRVGMATSMFLLEFERCSSLCSARIIQCSF